MADVEKINGSMTPQQADLERVARKGVIKRLRLLWDEGKASGTPVASDFGKLRQDARQQLENAKTNGR